jgi:hypothetical protein
MLTNSPPHNLDVQMDAEEMQNRIGDLERQNFLLKNKVQSLKSQLATYARNAYLPSRQRSATPSVNVCLQTHLTLLLQFGRRSRVTVTSKTPEPTRQLAVPPPPRVEMTGSMRMQRYTNVMLPRNAIDTTCSDMPQRQQITFMQTQLDSLMARLKAKDDEIERLTSMMREQATSDEK